MINRRQFFKAGAASALTGVAGVSALNNVAHAAVTPTDFKSLVYVFLDGGNDSFNMLIPNTTAEYNAYNRSRGGLAFERSDLKAISPRGLGANSFGLNPLMQGLKDVFDDGDASFVANVGPLIVNTTKSDIANGSAVLPTGLTSHSNFRSYWKGDHDNSPDTSNDGIGGRMANEFINPGRLPINISAGSGYDLYMDHAEQEFYAVSRSGLNKMRDYDLSLSNVYNSPQAIARRKAMSGLNQLASGSNNLLMQHSGNLLSRGLELSIEIQGFLENIPPLQVAFPAGNIGSRLRVAAEMISVREQLNMPRQIIFVRMSDYDTHGRQTTRHDRNMGELSEALAAFNEAMKELDVHSSVLLQTASEFGRTLSTNGDGSNHAWGGNHILMGGAIKGREIFGSYPVLELDGEEDYNGDGRFIPSTSVTQMGATIAKWFGVPQNRMSTVFPNIVNFRGREDLGYFS